MSRAEIDKALYGRQGSSHPRGTKCEEDGIVFDSKEEREYYRGLKIRQLVGEIKQLKCHTLFRIEVEGVFICNFTPDFTYIEVATNAAVVADYKGKKKSKKTGKLLPLVNREFHLKCKLMKACFGLDVKVV